MNHTAHLGAFAARSARVSDKLDRLGQSETTISQILHKGPTKNRTGSDLDEREKGARRVEAPFAFSTF
jgi:hypothetical protein